MSRTVEARKLDKRLHRLAAQAVLEFNMIEAGDKVMVCVSGGKDSYALLDILLGLRRRSEAPAKLGSEVGSHSARIGKANASQAPKQRAPIDFEIVAVNLDQKQPGFPDHVLPEYLAQRGVPFHIEARDTYSVVKRLVPEGRTMCSLCSRLRRGILYRVAGELGATKIALGHHRDDMVQTLFMNMFFGGRMKGMPPKLVSDDGRHVVIRPLAYVAEVDLERWAALRRYPIIPCTLCGSQPNLQRVQAREMLRGWEREHPGRIDNLVRAMGHIVPSHLMDRNLHPFATLKATGVASAQGDLAFDPDDLGVTPLQPMLLQPAHDAVARPVQRPAQG